MYEWLVNEGLSTNQILHRLRAQAVLTKHGKIRTRGSVQNILKNLAYMEKTYAFTKAHGQKQFSRAPENWIEIPDVTPAIITNEIFDAAQEQLQQNREKSTRNCKHDYLLKGYLRCCQCGRVYAGDYTYTRFYKCVGKKKAYNPVELC
jgi:site-specific DNA recombinase